MSLRNQRGPRAGRDASTQPPESLLRQPIWGRADAEAWHADSSLPASEALSELPEPILVEEELETPEAADDDDDDEPSEAAEDEADAGRGGSGDASRRRSKTIARKQMMRERRRMLAQGTLPEVLDYERPMSRAACREDKRPCLYVSCRYHLYLDVNPVTGSIKINFPDKEVWELEETCALDVAERGGITLEEVGEIMNLTRERIRQVEVSGLDKLRTGNGSLVTFLDGRELEVGGPSAAGQRRLPVIED
jgi:hypothetical protein